MRRSAERSQDMAIKLYSTDDGHVPAWEYLPAGEFQPQVGMGVAADSNGRLKASAVPTHIAMRTEGTTLDGTTSIPVVKIAADQVWESTLYSAAASAKVGMKVDLSSNGLWVDATKTTTGNFLITYLENTIRNSVVRGRFVEEKTSASS